MLVVIWAATGAGYSWPIWAMLGWGVSLAIHGWHTSGEKPITEEAIGNEDRGAR